MNNNRRKFLKQFAIGSGAIATGLSSFAATHEEMERSRQAEQEKQRFNMCGYAAPPMETVRIAVIGLGMRGSDAVERLSYIDGVEIVALCDKYPDRVERAPSMPTPASQRLAPSSGAVVGSVVRAATAAARGSAQP